MIPAPVSAPDITLDQVEAFLRLLGEAVAKLKPDAVGRQRDAGAELQYAGYLLLLQYEDPATPGMVYTANPAKWMTDSPGTARFQARRDLAVTNGIVGARANLLDGAIDNFGELRPLLLVLSSLGLVPPALGALVGATAADDPVDLLTRLLARSRGGA